MTKPVAFALAKLIVELRGRLALAGNLLEFTGIYRDYFDIYSDRKSVV